MGSDKGFGKIPQIDDVNIALGIPYREGNGISMASADANHWRHSRFRGAIGGVSLRRDPT
jgi:hypothetical protein